MHNNNNRGTFLDSERKTVFLFFYLPYGNFRANFLSDTQCRSSHTDFTIFSLVFCFHTSFKLESCSYVPVTRLPPSRLHLIIIITYYINGWANSHTWWPSSIDNGHYVRRKYTFVILLMIRKSFSPAKKLSRTEIDRRIPNDHVYRYVLTHFS